MPNSKLQTVTKQVVQKREFFNKEKARLEKYQVENYENALRNRQPTPPRTLKIQVDEVILHETNDPAERNVVEIRLTVTGPEQHIDGWQADVEKMATKGDARHGSRSLGDMYKERQQQQQKTEETGSDENSGD